MKFLLLFSLLLVDPVINPDNVRPGDWFTPKESQIIDAEQAAYRAYICAIRDNKVGPNDDCTLRREP